MEILKISSKSNPNSVAGALAVAPSGVDLVCIPAFAEVEVEGEDRTGIKLIVESRK